MADKIQSLIQISDLKTDYLSQVQQKKEYPLFIQYDDLSDTLMLLFISPRVETVVYYLDSYISLLYKPDTMDIVGMQVEDFTRIFLPQHEAVRRVWTLEEVELPEDRDFGVIAPILEHLKIRLAREILEAVTSTLKQLGKSEQSLKQALEPEMA